MSTGHQKNLKTQPLPVISHVSLNKTWAEEYIVAQLSQHYGSLSSIFFKFFLSTRKCKADIFIFLRFEEPFHKAQFSWQISVHRGPTCSWKKKDPFSNTSSIVCREPQYQARNVNSPYDSYAFLRIWCYIKVIFDCWWFSLFFSAFNLTLCFIIYSK